MPYNTRRKSLSLPSLGIQLPGASRSARSPPSTTAGQPVAKKAKRSCSGSISLLASPSRPLALRFDDRRASSSGRAVDTPPPSPGAEVRSTKVDTQGIDDDIVVAVIQQLEKTGNRPHLLKELAMVLSPSMPVVESSANPAAIISSRLATYLKRSWTALSKCPLDKKLVGVHPKRVYYFLSTCPHQPIPADTAAVPSTARIISPSLSSAASEEEDVEAAPRQRMSPSPELDLSDYDSHASDPFASQPHPPTTVNMAHNRRAQSPPLEKDEREFTQTASILQQRRKSLAAERERSASAAAEPVRTDPLLPAIALSVEESAESAALADSETAAALFGQIRHLSDPPSGLAAGSPMLRPMLHLDMLPPPFKPHAYHSANYVDDDDDDDDWNMKSPETIALDELDEMLGGF